MLYSKFVKTMFKNIPLRSNTSWIGCLAILFCFLFCLPTTIEAQRIPLRTLKSPTNIGRRLEKGSTRILRREVSKKKSSIKNKARTTVKDMKKLPKKQAGTTVDEEYNPTLDEAINDEEVKEDIVNRENKTRFVSLFAQWWMMPNELEMQARLRLAAMRDSLNQIDSAAYRVPKIVRDDQFVTVFGWHPHFNGNTYKSYNYELLTAIAYYSYDIDPYTGGYLDSNVIHDFLGGDKPEDGIVPTAHENDCKVLLSISSHSEDNNATFLEPYNNDARQNLIDQVVYLLDTSKADGIELNFENIPLEYKTEFYKFVRQITYVLRSINPNYAVCMSVPAYDPPGIFNLSRMKDDIDFFIIKGFDYQNDPNEVLGFKKSHNAPLNYSPASGEADLRSTIERYIAAIGPYHANRLILALPNYGTLWETTDQGYEMLDYVPYSEVMYNYVLKDKGLSKLDSNYYSFVWSKLDTLDGGRNIQETELYYDDVASLRIKYRFLQSYGLAGVGVWPLGYDVGFDQVWNTLAEEFTTIEIPELPGLEKLRNGTKRARRSSPIVLSVLLFWAIFASAGFCMALFNTNVRQTLFRKGRFRMIFLSFFTALIILIGTYFGLFEGKTSMLVVGVVLGSFFAYGIIVIMNKQRAKAP